MSTPSTVITVSELTFAIKNQLERGFAYLSIQGEMSNCKLHSSGHLYFDIKDAQAKISAVMFRSAYTKVSRPPKEGDHVIIRGSISVYPPQGKYQLLAVSLDYVGVGQLSIQFEILKKKLLALGLFSQERKKPLPKFPKTIGVITSPTGAVIRDIIHVLFRRNSGFQLILNPVRVQGKEAAREIALAIEQFNAYPLADVIILARGGGSLEDLWPFNEEIVAAAIFASKIPIISAIGHETDFTIADFVADLRAPTPSAAAEIVLSEKAHHLTFLEKMGQNISFALSHHLKRYRTKLDGYCLHPLYGSSYALLAGPMQRLDSLKTRLDDTMRQEILKRQYLLAGRQKEARACKPSTQLKFFRQRLQQLDLSYKQNFFALLQIKKQKINEVVERLKALDPKNVLKRGYSILFALNENSVIVSRQQLIQGQRIRALLTDGEVNLTVDDNNER